MVAFANLFLIFMTSTRTTVLHHIEATTLALAWPTTISAVSSITRISLEMILISAVLPAILPNCIFASSWLVTNQTIFVSFSFKVTSKMQPLDYLYSHLQSLFRNTFLQIKKKLTCRLLLWSLEWTTYFLGPVDLNHNMF